MERPIILKRANIFLIGEKMIDFEEMEKDLLERLGADEMEVILKDIEKLKKMSEKELKDFLILIEDFIEEHQKESIEEECDLYGDAAWEHFWKAHPNLSQDEDEVDHDVLVEYIDNLSDKEREAILGQEYEYLGDNERDTILRNSTYDAAENFKLQVDIVNYLFPDDTLL